MKFPGIKILDRYIIRKFLGTYVFAILMIVVIVVIFDAAEKIDDFTELHAPLDRIVLQYYVNFIPFFVNQFSGLFTFIAVIFFTSKMAYNTEIIAMLSGGMSFRRLMWPYFLSAAVITMLAVSLNLWVIPHANAQRVDFETQFLKSRQNVRYDRHIYRQLTPGTFVYIRDFSEQTSHAAFVAVQTYDSPRMIAAIEAQSARYEPATRRWRADRYLEYRFEGEAEILERKTNLDTLINLSTTELGRADELVQTMNIGELNAFIADQQAKGSDMIALFRVERHKRFAYPIATFILTLIGVSLSSRKVRGGTGLHIGVGIALCFSYILFSRFAEEFAKSGALPAGVSVWIPNVLYALVAIYLYRKAPK